MSGDRMILTKCFNRCRRDFYFLSIISTNIWCDLFKFGRHIPWGVLSHKSWVNCPPYNKMGG